MTKDNKKSNFESISKKLKISEKLLEKWSKYFEIKDFKMGQILISPDSISSHLYIVIEGEARLRGFSLNKKSAYTLGLLGPLSVLGLTSLRLKKSVGLVTASKKSSLLCIPKNLWEEFSLEVKKDPYSQFNIPDVDQAELWYLITRKFIQSNLPKEDRKSVV